MTAARHVADTGRMPSPPDLVALPRVDDQRVPNDLLARRRSTRSFARSPLSSEQLGALAWAAQGAVGGGRRTTPSAHALYPLTLTVVAGAVESLEPGGYRYDPQRHGLVPVAAGDRRHSVAECTLADRDWMCDAAALLLLSADIGGVNAHFAEQPPLGGRGERYVWLEAGHAGQNVSLAAAGLGIGAVLVAGLDDDLLRGHAPPLLPQDHDPLAVLAVGHPLHPRHS